MTRRLMLAYDKPCFRPSKRPDDVGPRSLLDLRQLQLVGSNFLEPSGVGRVSIQAFRDSWSLSLFQEVVIAFPMEEESPEVLVRRWIGSWGLLARDGSAAKASPVNSAVF